MKHTQTCPNCSHRRFAVLREFKIPERDINSARDIPVVVLEHGLERRTELGRFEVWICERCGLTEWYACGLQGLLALAEKYPSEVMIVDGDQGPYR